MNITLVTRGIGRGQGTAGYADGLARGLRARGHRVRVAAPGSMDRRGVLVALERVPRADLWRAGGGVHRVAMEAVGRRAAWADRRRESQAAATARVVVANSRMVADQLVRVLQVPPHRIEIVRTGVDLERFRVGPDPASTNARRVVLFAAHGWHRKGFDTAVRAFARVAGSANQLWVGGRDQARSRRMRAAGRLLGERLVDLGMNVDVAGVLGQVHAVLHPTRYDAAANLVLEGMAAGVPVVTTWMDGSAEVVPDPALVASKPGDDQEVSVCLQRALEHGRGALFRAAAEAWPDTRNHQQIEAIASRCEHG